MERDGLKKLSAVELVPRPQGKRVIKNRYVFSRKASGLFKARIVLKDFVKKGEKSKSAPVAEDASFKLLCAVAAQEDLDMHQCVVVQAFLNYPMDEEVYTELPEGWELPPDLNPKVDFVLLLKKALYGHRKAPFLWNKEIDSTLTEAGYTSSQPDACLYFKHVADSRTYILLHVDDFIVAGNISVERERLEQNLNSDYQIKHLGEVERYTNYQVVRFRKERKILLHQQDYIAEVLDVAGMKDCYGSKSKGSIFSKGLNAATSDSDIRLEENGVAYRTIKGALIHLSCHSRPDIAYEVATLSKYNSKPTTTHWLALKQLLRYLKYTSSYCLEYGYTSSFELLAYTDSGYASDTDTCRSPGGFMIFMGNALIAHKYKWFRSVYASTTEAEMAALHLCTSYVVWLRKLIKTFGYDCNLPTTIYEDNHGAMDYVSNNQRAGRMRHIDVSFHWIREKREEGSIQIAYVPSTDNLADAMTKTFTGTRLVNLCTAIGLKEPAHASTV